MPTNHIIIKGKVQGVFYRATAKDIARKLDITGWIKNNSAWRCRVFSYW
jgi:acylphosphatase